MSSTETKEREVVYLSSDSDSEASGDDVSDLESSAPRRKKRRKDSASSSSIAARSQPKPMHDALRGLIQSKSFNGSNCVKWFSMERLGQKAIEIKGKVGPPDQYIDSCGNYKSIVRQCGCLLPKQNKGGKRPEIKITEPFIVTAQERALICSNRGSKPNHFSRSTMKVNQNNSILIRKAVRMHSVVYAARRGAVWDSRVKKDAESSDGPLDVSHLCHNGEYGCVNDDHLTLENQKKNLERKDCWLAIRCAAPDCGGYIVGNPCKGHGVKPDGTPYELCIKPTLSLPCKHYSAHDVVAPLPASVNKMEEGRK